VPITHVVFYQEEEGELLFEEDTEAHTYVEEENNGFDE
jgi:hypothetical protein